MTAPGLWRRYVGAAGAEARLAVAAALLAGALLGALTVAESFPHRLLLALLAADACGGLVAQLLRPGSAPGGAAFRWVTGQGLQFALFAWFFRDGDPVRIALVAGVLVTAVLVLPRLPATAQRRAGLALTGAGLLLVDATVGLRPEAGWYLPLLLTKVCIAYLPETAPADRTSG
jgi:hypothetical protein